MISRVLVETAFGECGFPAGSGPAETGRKRRRESVWVFRDSHARGDKTKPKIQEENHEEAFDRLLSLGLVLAFSMTASALNVKFSGRYYPDRCVGNSGTVKNDAYPPFSTHGRSPDGVQNCRGLDFTTRFDALEKRWGQTNWGAGIPTVLSRPMPPLPGTSSHPGEFRVRARLRDPKTAIGGFQVGYHEDVWGTAQRSETTTPDLLPAAGSVDRISFAKLGS